MLGARGGRGLRSDRESDHVEKKKTDGRRMLTLYRRVLLLTPFELHP